MNSGIRIGGYQVCEKWLKDRKDRKLSKTDIEHYQKIIAALRETIRIMSEIVILENKDRSMSKGRFEKTLRIGGGWTAPGSFYWMPHTASGRMAAERLCLQSPSHVPSASGLPISISGTPRATRMSARAARTFRSRESWLSGCSLHPSPRATMHSA